MSDLFLWNYIHKADPMCEFTRRSRCVPQKRLLLHIWGFPRQAEILQPVKKTPQRIAPNDTSHAHCAIRVDFAFMFFTASYLRVKMQNVRCGLVELYSHGGADVRSHTAEPMCSAKTAPFAYLRLSTSGRHVVYPMKNAAANCSK